MGVHSHDMWWATSAYECVKKALGRAERKVRDTRRDQYYRNAYKRYLAARRAYEKDQESVMHFANEELHHVMIDKYNRKRKQKW